MNLNFDDNPGPRRAQDFLKEKMSRRKEPDYTNVSTNQFMPEKYDYEGKGYTKPSQDKYRDTANFDSVNRARQASAAAQDTVKADDMFKGLRQATVDTSDYYRQSARKRTLGLFGDVWNVKGGPKWESPDAPDKIETTYDS